MTRPRVGDPSYSRPSALPSFLLSDAMREMSDRVAWEMHERVKELEELPPHFTMDTEQPALTELLVQVRVGGRGCDLDVY